MVPSLQEQGNVMIECAHNYTPDVMVIDEIGRPAEVAAARTCKQRGVRLIASAQQGDLRILMKNSDLSELVGCVSTANADERVAQGNMDTTSPTGHNRIGAPVFDIIVELVGNDEWRIILDSATAVDQILAFRPYLAQRRKRNPQTGSVHMEVEQT